MASELIQATETQKWREALDAFAKVDVCQMPEYHVAYSTRIEASKPVMWLYEDSGQSFCYPFLLTSVLLGEQKEHSGYQDISSIYGYSGPLATTTDAAFLDKAWAVFDEWSAEQKIIAEFIRFSIYAGTKEFAHKDTEILGNRPSAISWLPDTEDELMAALPSKTRNMVRKAWKSDLVSRELDLKDGIPQFRSLYEETMDRNDAPEFFLYDDRYYDLLMSLPDGELRLYGVFMEDRMIAAAMALAHGEGSLYHLGASLGEYNSLGAGNLAMYEMHKGLMDAGVAFLHVGGGRTTAEDDPLYRFKKNNAIDADVFHIGKRIVDKEGYAAVAKRWEELYKTEVNSHNLQFYR